MYYISLPLTHYLQHLIWNLQRTSENLQRKRFHFSQHYVRVYLKRRFEIVFEWIEFLNFSLFCLIRHFSFVFSNVPKQKSSLELTILIYTVPAILIWSSWNVHSLLMTVYKYRPLSFVLHRHHFSILLLRHDTALDRWMRKQNDVTFWKKNLTTLGVSPSLVSQWLEGYSFWSIWGP